MDDRQLSKKACFLTRILRHNPGCIGIELDSQGWADVDTLISKVDLTREQLERIAQRDNKQRFAFNEEGTCIRASQGRTVPIELGLSPTRPPNVLYHGTSANYLSSILRTGLNPGRRNHVHLSVDLETARIVGRRHGGATVVLKVDAKGIYKSGGQDRFILSENGVWLIEKVEPQFLTATLH